MQINFTMAEMHQFIEEADTAMRTYELGDYEVAAKYPTLEKTKEKMVNYMATSMSSFNPD